MAVNKVILVGNLGRDPEIRYTPAGKAVGRFPLATGEVWTDPDGNRQERTEWHNIVVWGKQAETCSQYLSKGRQVFVEGSIRSRSYDDRDGNRRYITEIIGQRVQFLGGGRAGDVSAAAPPPPGPEEPSLSGGSIGEPSAPGSTVEEDDIPF